MPFSFSKHIFMTKMLSSSWINNLVFVVARPCSLASSTSTLTLSSCRWRRMRRRRRERLGVNQSMRWLHKLHSPLLILQWPLLWTLRLFSLWSLPLPLPPEKCCSLWTSHPLSSEWSQTLSQKYQTLLSNLPSHKLCVCVLGTKYERDGERQKTERNQTELWESTETDKTERESAARENTERVCWERTLRECAERECWENHGRESTAWEKAACGGGGGQGEGTAKDQERELK